MMVRAKSASWTPKGEQQGVVHSIRSDPLAVLEALSGDSAVKLHPGDKQRHGRSAM
jgi:hypothetical protein